MARVNDKNSATECYGAATQQLSAIGMVPMIFMWSVEMLTVEGFADKMKISEGTLWTWIKDNTLKEHRHYFQKNKIIRFPWGPELIKAIMDDGLFDQIEEETADTPAFNKETAVLQTNGVTNGLNEASVNPAIIPHKTSQQKSRMPFGDVLPIATEDLQSNKVVKSPGRKRRSFSGCPLNPDLLK